MARDTLAESGSVPKHKLGSFPGHLGAGPFRFAKCSTAGCPSGWSWGPAGKSVLQNERLSHLRFEFQRNSFSGIFC